MKQLLFLLILSLSLNAYELLELFENNTYISKVNYADKRLTLASKNEFFIVDLLRKNIIDQGVLNYEILAISKDKVVLKNALTFSSKLGYISNPLSYQNSAKLLFHKGNEVLLFDTNSTSKKLSNNVKPTTAFIGKSGIYISFFSRNLIKFDEALNILEDIKTPNLITSILELDDTLILGDSKGNLYNDKVKINLLSQIDAICECGDKICIGDYKGNLYIYDKNIEKEEGREHIFNERVRALFYDDEVGIIAVSWKGDIAILNKED
ncbi:MAG: hypothetical protein GXZ15_03740 [Campylobacter sp.]|nr:hypothetical protein [Campylobacter sp.]